MDTPSYHSERLSSTEKQAIRISYPGIAARLDRLPSGTWHRKVMFLFGGVVFCDCLDMYVGGGILAQLLQNGWSTVDLNAVFASITMIGYLLGALFAGYLGDRFGRRKSLLFSTMLFSVMTFLAAFAPTMETLIVMRGLMGVGLGGALPGSYGALSEYTPPLVRGRYASWLGLIGNFSPPLGALLTVLVIPIFGWQAIFIGISLISLLLAHPLALLARIPTLARFKRTMRRSKRDRIVSRTQLSAAGHRIARDRLCCVAQNYPARTH